MIYNKPATSLSPTNRTFAQSSTTIAQKLPLGLQDFRGIIEGGYKYIDKTKYVYQLCSTGKYYFLSRPRRFGKSITLTMLQELYLGSQEVFKGLCMADKGDWNRKHPVIRISFSALGFQENGLQASLSFALDELIREHQIPAIQGNIINKFAHLIKQLAQKTELLCSLTNTMPHHSLSRQSDR